jgi:nucleotide-binding universal stress UspA family protein
VPEERRWVVAEVDASPASDAALLRAIEEARLRDAPLRVVTTWQSRYTDIHDNRAVAQGNRLTKARLNRRLAEWRKRYPDLDIEAVAVHGSFLNYVAKNAQSIGVLVIPHGRPHGISELIGTPVSALRQSNCSVVISEPQNVL